MNAPNNTSTTATDSRQATSYLSSGIADFKPNLKGVDGKALLPNLGNENTEVSTIEIGATETKLHARTNSLTKLQQELDAFIPLESWSGKIEEVDLKSRTYTATVISHDNGAQESAEFGFDEISEDDLELVEPGAMFYWSVGYQIDIYRRRSTASVIRFKRIRHWTRKELEQATANASDDLAWFLTNRAQPNDAAKP
ncbi:MAG: hypothetical protein K5880_11710 [Hydrogenophaga sp.]|uniref:hypothetical protein n=1 Tax=Hydrogenophaga sp. TaxID=1904254 RepID=UPI0026228FBC|nr:hypothetical protein [Hydrogenophaga sp.]MCV0439292.1 hypothetical protein [Hydrogenophaga sp.]